MQTLIVLGIVGFFAQLVDGALGMAYGTTSTTLVLAVGLSPAVASATVHMAELGTRARLRHVALAVRKRRLAHGPAGSGSPGAIGAFIGAVALSSISAEVAKPWMAAILLAILGVYILVRFALGRAPRPRGRPYVRGRYLAGLGLFGGLHRRERGRWLGPCGHPDAARHREDRAAQGDRLGRHERVPRRARGEHRVPRRARKPGHLLGSSWAPC